MSKTFELLTELAKRVEYSESELTVYASGEAEVAIDGYIIIDATDEADLILKLTKRLLEKNQ